MDHYLNNLTLILAILFITLSIFISLYFFRKSKLPKRTSIGLPDEIVFHRKTDDKYGIGTRTLDVLTLGGHGRLKKAKFDYEERYAIYVRKFNTSIKLRKQINNRLNDIGAITFHILRELEKSQKLLDKDLKSRSSRLSNEINTSNSLNSLQLTTQSHINSGVILLQGGVIGGLAAVGSWTVVSMLGTASTGTAIASRSGAAAHNAILAWFGGGALAAGGGGMAAGTVVLGVIVAVPLLIFASYKTHSSAEDLENKTVELLSEISSLNKQNELLHQVNNLSQQQLTLLKNQFEKIKKANTEAYTSLYPNGVFSRLRRNLNVFVKGNYYTKQEALALDKVSMTIKEFYSLLDEKVPNSVASISYQKNK